MKKETAQKAAKWWADHLRNGAPLDNGDPSDTGLMTMMMGLMLQKDTRQDESTIDSFEQELAEAILENNPWSFGVDYHPDYIISEAARKAGCDLSMASLPWKTHMWIDEDKITVKLGYGSEAMELR